eukprot:m.710858 g.710858  ORF g.710858 m.710858 type:complete len:54 (-) comp58765_c0_seq16:119-280(-)
MSEYGRSPSEKTSQQSTPKDHTSLLEEYLRSEIDSGAIHLTGTCTQDKICLSH